MTNTGLTVQKDLYLNAMIRLHKYEYAMITGFFIANFVFALLL